MAMKDEPIDVETMLGSVPADHLENLQDKISTQEELTCLGREVADLKVILRQKVQLFLSVVSQESKPFKFLFLEESGNFKGF